MSWWNTPIVLTPLWLLKFAVGLVVGWVLISIAGAIMVELLKWLFGELNK